MGLFGRKEFNCEICGAKFESQDKLAEHNQVHAEPMSVAS